MLVDRADTQAKDLRDGMEDERDEELKEKVNEYVDDLTENADEVSERLDDAHFGTFDVIWGSSDSTTRGRSSAPARFETNTRTPSPERQMRSSTI